MCSERIKVIASAMVEITGEEDFSAGHIFIESDTEDEEGLMAVMAQQQNAFFTMIANFHPVAINTLPYQKGPAMLGIDASIIGALESNIQATAQTMKEMDSKMGVLLELRNSNSKEVERVDKEIREINTTLLNIDNDGKDAQAEHAVASWGFFWYPEKCVELTSKHRDYEITVTDTSGWEPPVVKEVNRVVKKIDDDRFAITVNLQVPHYFKSLKAKVVVSSANRDIHAKLIKDKKEQAKEAKERRERMRDQHRVAEQAIKVEDELSKATAHRHTVCCEMRSFLMTDWTVEEYKGMKAFYAEALAGEHDANTLMRNFQAAWESYYRSIGFFEHLGWEPVPIL